MNAVAATEPTPAEKIAAVMAELGLTISAEFIPFSKSRNAAPREDGKVWRSLNWRVTVNRTIEASLHRDKSTRPILTTDYAQGEGHCPAYKASVKALGNRNSIMRDAEIAWECEHGFAAWSATANMITRDRTRPILPDAVSVMASLIMDASVLDCGSFEEWAGDLGYDTDSRKAEATYRACLDIALKLRNGIGEAGLAKLRDACQDY